MIDLWSGEKFKAKKFIADCSHYPGGSFGYSYRGNIYDDAGRTIGDFATNNYNDFLKWFK